MTKKIIAIFAAILITASLASCNNGKNPNEETTGSKINIDQTENTTEEPSSDVTEEPTEDTTEKEEVTTDNPSSVDRYSDPGEFTYIAQNDMVYVMNKINNLPLRSGDFEYLAEFKNGAVLQRTGISEDGRWSRVIVGGVEGYVATRNVTTYNPASTSFEAMELTLTAATTLNVRIYPDFPVGIDTNDESEVYCNVAGQVYENGEVKVIGYDETRGWYKVEFTPVEGVLDSGYNYEFFIKADDSFFVETQETETTEEITTEPVVEIVVPAGYKIQSTPWVSFAIPNDFATYNNNTLFIGSSGSNINVVQETYTEDHNVYFEMTVDIFNEIFVPVYEAMEMTVEDVEVVQGTVSNCPMVTMKFKATLDDVISYMTQFCIKTNETTFVVVTVTEPGAESGMAAVVAETITVVK